MGGKVKMGKYAEEADPSTSREEFLRELDTIYFERACYPGKKIRLSRQVVLFLGCQENNLITAAIFVSDRVRYNYWKGFHYYGSVSIKNLTASLLIENLVNVFFNPDWEEVPVMVANVTAHYDEWLKEVKRGKQNAGS